LTALTTTTLVVVVVVAVTTTTFIIVLTYLHFLTLGVDVSIVVVPTDARCRKRCYHTTEYHPRAVTCRTVL